MGEVSHNEIIAFVLAVFSVNIGICVWILKLLIADHVHRADFLAMEIRMDRLIDSVSHLSERISTVEAYQIDVKDRITRLHPRGEEGG